MAYYLIDLIIGLVFPKQCFSCKAWGKFICPECEFLIPIIKHQRCIECQKPSLLGITHPKCINKFSPDRLITIFNYQQSIISQAINTGKIAMIPEIFTELAKTAITKLEITNNLKNNFIITPIPLSRYKQRFRGFNQSYIISNEISQVFSIPIDNLLVKNTLIKQQKKLDKQARQKNMEYAFRLLNNHSLPKSVLLIDDVSTTGATFKAATKILKKAGIIEVWCLAIAQD